MTIREATALVLLYRACVEIASSPSLLANVDESLRRRLNKTLARSRELVPGLAELSEVVVPMPEKNVTCLHGLSNYMEP